MDTLSLNKIGSILTDEVTRGTDPYALTTMFKHATRSWVNLCAVAVEMEAVEGTNSFLSKTLIGALPVMSATMKLRTMSRQ